MEYCIFLNYILHKTDSGSSTVVHMLKFINVVADGDKTLSRASKFDVILEANNPGKTVNL